MSESKSTHQATDGILRGSLPLVWFALAALAGLFVSWFFLPVNDATFGETATELKHSLTLILPVSFVVVAVLTILIGWPTWRETLAATCSFLCTMSAFVAVIVLANGNYEVAVLAILAIVLLLFPGIGYRWIMRRLGGSKP